MEAAIEDKEGGKPPFLLSPEELESRSLMSTYLDSRFMVEWRKKHRLSQQALADLAGVNVRTVKKWELDERPIPAYMGLFMAAIQAGLKPVALPVPLKPGAEGGEAEG